MAQSSFALLTNTGRAKEAAALANATTIEITHIAIGDGATVPSGGETALYNEVARKTISGHGTVVGAENVAYFDCYLAAPDGPYTIREAGLYDSEGDLIAIAHYDPPISKPVPASGQTVEGTVRIEVAFSNIATVVIKVDPSMQVALQRLTQLPWIAVMEMGRNDPPAAPAPGDVYVIGSEPTGTWAGHAGKVAEYTLAGWALLAPRDGHGVGLPDGRVFERVGGVYVEKIALDVQSGRWLWGGAAGGTANALALTLTPAPPAYTDGMAIRFKVTAANTDAVTANVNGLGAVPILRANGDPLSPGDLALGAIISTSYSTAANALLADPSLRSDILAAAQLPETTVSYATPGSHTFVVPAGVYSILARLWGGGGGGGYVTTAANGTSGASGGAGGAYAEKRFPVTPGDEIAIIVGAGGLGGDGTREGQPGLASSVTAGAATVTAGGGDGGRNATVANTLALGSYGGVYSGADFGVRGGNGNMGTVGTVAVSTTGGGVVVYGMSGGGGASPSGGAGRNLASLGDAGAAPGGGGFGSSNHDYGGGTGGRGEVRISYIPV